MAPDVLPAGLVLSRTTDLFDSDNVPAGLLRAHRLAEEVWGRLIVRHGAVRFVFEDAPDDPLIATAGQPVVIPPARLHHVELDGPVQFAVEFWRRPTAGRH